MRPLDRERFEIRRVDEERRVYVYVSDDRKYHDACIQADHARRRTGAHYVVWDAFERRVLYDSRLLLFRDA